MEHLAVYSLCLWSIVQPFTWEIAVEHTMSERPCLDWRKNAAWAIELEGIHLWVHALLCREGLQSWSVKQDTLRE